MQIRVVLLGLASLRSNIVVINYIGMHAGPDIRNRLHEILLGKRSSVNVNPLYKIISTKISKTQRRCHRWTHYEHCLCKHITSHYVETCAMKYLLNDLNSDKTIDG